MYYTLGLEIMMEILEGPEMKTVYTWISELNKDQRDSMGLFGFSYDEVMAYFDKSLDPIGNAIQLFTDYLDRVQPTGLSVPRLTHILDNYEA